MNIKTACPLLILVGLCVLTPAAVAEERVPLKIKLPDPLEVGTPVEIKGVPNLEPAPKEGVKRPDFLVPKGTVLLSKGKNVTSSDTDPINGSLDLITDGDKEGADGSWVELHPGKQWVQLDLEKSAEVAVIVVWHFHSEKFRAYHSIIVQVSDDPAFKTGVTTVFNNDYANTVGLGAGKDHPYVENYQGKLIDARGAKGRYVRLYSAGNTKTRMNHYIEVEIFGKPAA